jgi:hypothetical protein
MVGLIIGLAYLHVRERVGNGRKQQLERVMYHNAKGRARRAGLPFNLTRDDIKIPTHCPILGTELTQGAGRMLLTSPSLDKIIPEKGYIKGNIAIISMRANQLKSNATLAELEKLLVWMRKQEDNK